MLVAVAVLGCLLLPSGAVLLAIGVVRDQSTRTVVGILLGIAGLACFRILHWARRIRLMTRAGLDLRLYSDDDHRRFPGEPPSS
jgi:hypothetical protein